MRNTRQRQIVYDFVNHSCNHPTAYEVYDNVQRVLPSISLGTVYRLLNKLVWEGKIKCIKMPNNIDRFDHLGEKHIHFLCIKCNRVHDLPLDCDFKLNLLEEVIDYEINVKGICQKCREGIDDDGIKRQ